LKKNKREIKFIDLFAGIGGIRLGFEQAAKELNQKSKCVFTSEYDKYACDTYRKNFPIDDHNPLNDITEKSESNIPEFDVLLAGFPCQAFSIAGKKGGFEDTRGTLFFDVARIIKKHRPKAFLLENVKGLVNHKSGKTLATILNVLNEDLGYNFVQFNVLNAKYYGVPQNRERIYIVGFESNGGSFSFPNNDSIKKYVQDIIEKQEVNVRFYLSTVYLKCLKEHRARHEAKGNGFGYEIIEPDSIANAIVVGGMGKERNLLIDKRLTNFVPETNIKGKVNREGIRRMTPIEWERLQGFPDDWTKGVSNAQRYKQLGNSVAVPVIKQVCLNIIKELLQPVTYENTTSKQLTMQF